MAEPIRPNRAGGHVVFPRQSTQYEIRVTYFGDVEPCLEFVKKVGDGYGFHVELSIEHDASQEPAQVTLRGALSRDFAQTLENLNGIQQYAKELGLYAE